MSLCFKNLDRTAILHIVSTKWTKSFITRNRHLSDRFVVAFMLKQDKQKKNEHNSFTPETTMKDLVVFVSRKRENNTKHKRGRYVRLLW